MRESFVLGARIRFASLWLSQVARVLADWCLRIGAWLEAARAGEAQRNSAWHLVTAVFIAPFIFLAPLNGCVSNGLPKRWVLTGAAAYCLLVTAGFTAAGGPWLWCLGLMAVGSALYSPTRYAMLPAAARDTGVPLPRVNGWIEMGGAAAIVGGILLGLELTGNAWLGLPGPIAAVLLLNLLCLLTALPVSFPSDVRRPEPPAQAVASFFRDCRRIFADCEARGSLLGLAAFQALVTAGTGALFTQALGYSLAGITRALVLVCVGAVLGCGLSSLQGHPRRCLGLVPYGATGLLLALAWGAASMGSDPDLPAVPCLLLGVMGGLVNVPLRAAYLAAVPADARGNATAVMNLAIYVLTVAVALVMVGLVQAGVLPTPAAQLGFLAAVAALGAALAWRLLFVPALEQACEIVLWPIYRIHAFGPGARQIPTRGPVLLVANHSSYLDPFWVAKVVPRHVTPMMTSVFYDLPVIRWFMVHVVGAIRVPYATFRREAPELRDAVEVLKGGGCLLIFPEGMLRRHEEPLTRPFGQGAWRLLRELPQTPVVTFWIEGGWGSWASYKGGPPMKGKRIDKWWPIRIGVAEPRVIDPATLADQRATRAYLRRAVLECRRYLGLDVPPEEDARKEEGADREEAGADSHQINP
jgi:1-acyl-sn-glycerol-3-phosphate acyltransferase